MGEVYQISKMESIWVLYTAKHCQVAKNQWWKCVLPLGHPALACQQSSGRQKHAGNMRIEKFCNTTLSAKFCLRNKLNKWHKSTSSANWFCWVIECILRLQESSEVLNQVCIPLITINQVINFVGTCSNEGKQRQKLIEFLHWKWCWNLCKCTHSHVHV